MTETKKNPGSIELNQELINYVEQKGAKIYLDFDSRYDKNKQTIGFKIFSKSEFENLTINNFTLMFYDKTENISINKSFNKDIFKKVYYPNHNDVSIYYGWESYNQSKVFLNFDKLFNKLNIDTNFPLSIIINYNLDKSNYSEELFYIVNVSEKKKFAPAYIYKHFRGF